MLTTGVGKLILDNYKQALRIVSEDAADLEVLSAKLGTTAEDYERDVVQERLYLENLKSEPPEVSTKRDYLDALQDLNEARYDIT